MDTKDDKSTEDTSPRLREESVACVKGCGFYGTASTNNMCSSCFKKSNAELKKTEETKITVIKETKSISESVSIPSAPAPIVTQKEIEVQPLPAPSLVTPEGGDNNKQPPARVEQKIKTRCFTCKKKVGFTGCECRCGYIFCGDHRYVDAHACDFDYKSLKKTILTEANPLIAFSKVEKL